MAAIKSSGVLNMENYLETLTNALNMLCASKTNHLDKYYLVIKKYNYEDLLIRTEGQHEFYEEIENLLQIRPHMYFSSEQKILLNEILNEIFITNNIEKKKVLIPLILFLDTKSILFRTLILKDFFVNLEEHFIKMLRSTKINFSDNIPLSELHYEKSWLKKYNEALKKDDILKMYDFISACERGNLFFSGFEPFNLATLVLNKYSFEELIKILDDIESPLEAIYFTSDLDIQDKLTIALKTSNIYIKFEVIRSLVYFKNNNYQCKYLMKNEEELLSELILTILFNEKYKVDFLKFYLIYPSRAIQLFRPLGQALNNSSNITLDLFLEILKINEFHNEDSIMALNQCIFNIKDTNKQEYLMERIFDKWSEYIIKGNIEYFGSIMYTDVIDIVIVYIKECMKKDKCISLLKQYVEQIKEIDNIWLRDKTSYQNYFYSQLSHIFVLSFVLEKFELIEIKKNIMEILHNNIILTDEYARDKETSIEAFNKYIFNTSKGTEHEIN